MQLAPAALNTHIFPVKTGDVMPQSRLSVPMIKYAKF